MGGRPGWERGRTPLDDLLAKGPRISERGEQFDGGWVRVSGVEVDPDVSELGGLRLPNVVGVLDEGRCDHRPGPRVFDSVAPEIGAHVAEGLAIVARGAAGRVVRVVGGRLVMERQDNVPVTVLLPRRLERLHPRREILVVLFAGGEVGPTVRATYAGLGIAGARDRA